MSGRVQGCLLAESAKGDCGPRWMCNRKMWSVTAGALQPAGPGHGKISGRGDRAPAPARVPYCAPGGACGGLGGGLRQHAPGQRPISCCGVRSSQAHSALTGFCCRAEAQCAGVHAVRPVGPCGAISKGLLAELSKRMCRRACDAPHVGPCHCQVKCHAVCL